jgi:hypothetical protein
MSPHVAVCSVVVCAVMVRAVLLLVLGRALLHTSAATNPTRPSDELKDSGTVTGLRVVLMTWLVVCGMMVRLVLLLFLLIDYPCDIILLPHAGAHPS